MATTRNPAKSAVSPDDVDPITLPVTALPATPGTFADLPSVVTYATALRAAAETRIAALEAKVTALINSLQRG